MEHTRSRRGGLWIAAALVATLGCASATEERPWGAACGPEAPCTGGLACITSPRFPGGYCAAECGASPCAAGALCDGASSPAVCLRACAGADECRDGYQCWQGACRPGCDVDPATCGADAVCVEARCQPVECTTDADCAAGRRCDGRACVDATPPDDAGASPRPVGARCAVDADCEGGLCLPADRGGVCSAACDRADACFTAVDFESDCGPVARAGALTGACLPYDGTRAGLAEACTSDADCGSRTCVAGQCTEVCAADADCLPGQTCRPLAWGGGTFRGCGFADGTGTVEVPLGEVEIDAGGLGPPMQIAVPADGVSLTLRARTVGGATLPLMFYELSEPDGTVVYSLEEIAALRDTPLRWIPAETEEAIAMLDPNSTRDRLPFAPGPHGFRVGAFTDTPTDTRRTRVAVSALVKRAPGGTVSSGRIDLRVHLVGVGVTAADAPRHARLQGTLARFGRVLGAAGLSVGDVTYTEVTGADATRLQVIDSVSGVDSELSALFRLDAAAPPNALCLYFVRSLEGGASGFSLLGVAGGIPGPAGLAGTQHSGVVLAFDPGVVGDDPIVPGTVLAHETSHFLGLFHTTEQGPPCGAGGTPPDCAPFGGTDVIPDTRYGDAGNLMHWSLGDGASNTAITAGQAFVLVRNPLVR